MAENSLKVLKTKEKAPKPLSLSVNSWSCWADSNCRPHPYQRRRNNFFTQQRNKNI